MAKKKTTKKAAKKKPPTKSEVFTLLADSTDLTKKQITAVFDELGTVIRKNLNPRGAGQFTLPGLCKMVVKKKPARKAHKGINPFTKEEQMFAAKPASKTVRIRPLKNLKDMVS